MSSYGNLQKIRNGKRTFAITPHIPGGFILPEISWYATSMQN